MHKLTAFASIDVAANNAAYYYHFDGLGSVVALSNSDGDSCQSYEYSVYGQVAASDPNFIANPYMFTGRRFDIETGLYYYRARYYNPHIGRFMQTDPVGYDNGINWYLYCGNNPLGFVDPYGLASGQVVTGRYQVLPWELSEYWSQIQESDILSEFFGGFIIDLGELPGNAPSVEEIDNQLAQYEAALRNLPTLVIAALIKGNIPAPSLHFGWASYIEVQDWEDTNNKGVVDECDTFSDPYWLHIEAFGAYDDNIYNRGAWHQESYFTPIDAADAAGTAIGAAWNMGINREGFLRVLPTAKEVAGIILDGWDEDPYNREEHY